MNALLKVSSQGARTKHAISSIEADGELLASAIKRAVPFLGRTGGQVVFLGAASGLAGEAIRSLEGPDFLARFATNPGGSGGVLAFDGPSVALLVDGVLGGGRGKVPKLERKSLSSAQHAFMKRVAKSVLDSIGETLEPRGISLTSVSEDREEGAEESNAILALFEVTVEGAKGRILLAVASDVSQTRLRAAPPVEPPVDPRIAAVVNQVEIELIVELGRVRLPIQKVSRLETGMTLLVDTSVGGRVTVRSGRHELLRGEPTTGNGQIAIRICEQSGSRHGT